MRVHDLRYTAGSILFDEGVPLTTVSAFLGHSTPATTASVYAHALRKGESIAEFLDADKTADK
ncbi:tyrosine-type recombinase/integrase [Desulfofarcimen acetoxidans]|uniref:tyrosine-type recombinase/integrase n=1 Tax=Desulfofarcimen acetoxidans TaxID=58138 RepID=UPI000A06DD3A|nr:tyrosine-type recombinase/integrase [Desulfofarcimen acetoxidans]